ncbi:MAG: hypothetical protein AB7E95_01155 [Kiritimatiellales bacterium]
MPIHEVLMLIGFGIFLLVYLWVLFKATMENPLWLFGLFIPFVLLIYFALNLKKLIIPTAIAVAGLLIAIIGGILQP